MNSTRIYINEKLAYVLTDHWGGQQVYDFVNRYHRVSMKLVRYEHVTRNPNDDWNIVSVKKFIWFADWMAFTAA